MQRLVGIMIRYPRGTQGLKDVKFATHMMMYRQSCGSQW